MNIRAASSTEIRKAIERAMSNKTLSDQAFHDEAALRAMQAIIGLISGETEHEDMDKIAEAAFTFADDMLHERKKLDND